MDLENILYVRLIVYIFISQKQRRISVVDSRSSASGPTVGWLDDLHDDEEDPFYVHIAYGSTNFPKI
jgi:hypothetical protein